MFSIKNSKILFVFSVVFLLYFTGCSNSPQVSTNLKDAKLFKNLHKNDNLKFYTITLTDETLDSDIKKRLQNIIYIYNSDEKILYADILPNWSGCSNFFTALNVSDRTLWTDEYMICHKYDLDRYIENKDDWYKRFKIVKPADLGISIRYRVLKKYFIPRNERGLDIYGNPSSYKWRITLKVEMVDYSQLLKKYIKAIRSYNSNILTKADKADLSIFLTAQLNSALKKADSVKKLQNLNKIADYASVTINHKIFNHKLLVYKNQENMKKKFHYYLHKASVSELETLLHSNQLVGIKHQTISNIKARYHLLAHQRYTEKLNEFISSSSLSAMIKEYEKPTFITQKNSRKILKKSIIVKARKLETKYGFSQAYRFSNSKNDLEKVLSYCMTISDLEVFLNKYKYAQYHNVLKKAKKRLVLLYRKENTFDGFFGAYKLYSNVNDVKYALYLAKTAEQKAKIEKVVFKNIKNKSALINVKLISEDSYTDYDEDEGGMFTKYSLSGKLHITSKIKVSWNEDSPFQPVYGTYKVLVKLLVVAPRYLQRRSNWVGNADENNDATQERTFSIKLNAKKMKETKSYDLGSIVTTFFERGSAGGFTAKWLRDNAYVKIKSIQITFDSASTIKNKPLNININRVFAYKKPLRSNTLVMKGSLADSNKLIDRFNNIDRSQEGSGTSSSNNSVNICVPSIPQPSEYSQCSGAKTASGKYATVQLKRGGVSLTGGANCFDLTIYANGSIANGSTCGGANGSWSVIVNGQSGVANGLGNAIAWLLRRM